MDSYHPPTENPGGRRLRMVSWAKRAFLIVPGERDLARTIRPFKVTIFCVKTKGIPSSANLSFLNLAG